MEFCNHVSDCKVLEFNIVYEISKNTYLPHLIYLFSTPNLCNDVFNNLERVAFDCSVINE